MGQILLQEKPYNGELPVCKRGMPFWWQQPCLPLSKEERQHVTAVALHNEESAEWGTPGGADTEDYCFCMSYQEALRYFTGNAQRAVGTPWWLRTPGIESSYTATVSGFGVINANGQESHTEGIGVLPALWIETSVADR